MKSIELHGGEVALVDDEDEALVRQYKWHVNTRDGVTWYAEASPSRGKTMSMHRLITGAPKGTHVDHANCDGLDNRRANMRVCTPGQNHMNRRKSSGLTSQFKGVSWAKKDQRWVAQAQLDKKKRHLGQFKSEIAAAIAYDQFARANFGKFARLNFQYGAG